MILKMKYINHRHLWPITKYKPNHEYYGDEPVTHSCHDAKHKIILVSFIQNTIVAFETFLIFSSFTMEQLLKKNISFKAWKITSRWLPLCLILINNYTIRCCCCCCCNRFRSGGSCCCCCWRQRSKAPKEDVAVIADPEDHEDNEDEHLED